MRNDLLVVLTRGEDAALFDGDLRVALDDRVGVATDDGHAERARRDIEKHRARRAAFDAAARERRRLDRSADGDDLVGVDIGARPRCRSSRARRRARAASSSSHRRARRRPICVAVTLPSFMASSQIRNERCTRSRAMALSASTVSVKPRSSAWPPSP